MELHNSSRNVLIFPLLFFSIFCNFVSSNEASNWKVSELWNNFPGSTYLNVYMFNVTNPIEFLANPYTVKPSLEQIGPYVYRVEKRKVGAVAYFDENFVKFKEEKKFYFEPNLSNGLTENDQFNIVNAQLIIYGTRMALTNSWINDLMYMTSLTDPNGEKLIRTNEKLKDILFNGIDASIYVEHENGIESISGGPKPIGFAAFEDGRYSFLKNKNVSNYGELQLNSSQTDLYGQIISLDEKTQLSFWNGTTCNDGLQGSTDGSLFSKSSSPSPSVYLHEICRSVNLIQGTSMEYNGIQSSHFQFDESFLNYPTTGENNCFCTDLNANCLKDGALDIQSCHLGAPYVISRPSFGLADSNYTDSVEGLPDYNKYLHESTYLIEPVTGTVLTSTKRFQLNIRVGAQKTTTYLKDFPEILFPIFWTEETYTLDDNSLASLKSALEDPTTTTIVPSSTTRIPTDLPSSTSPTTTIATELPTTAAPTITTSTPVTTNTSTSTSTTIKPETTESPNDLISNSNYYYYNKLHEDFLVLGKHFIFFTVAVTLLLCLIIICTLEILRRLTYPNRRIEGLVHRQINDVAVINQNPQIIDEKATKVDISC